ncbi:hypothetical protein [Okeania sp. SIO3I5]|nr:hypothetical protein [Okeania sp. SIO3I5]
METKPLHLRIIDLFWCWEWYEEGLETKPLHLRIIDLFWFWE